MIVKLLNEHYLEFLSLKAGCRGSSESTHVKMSHCWKFYALAQIECLNWEEASGYLVSTPQLRQCVIGYFIQTKHICTLIHIWPKGEVGALWNLFKPSSKISLLKFPRWYFFCGSFVLFMSCVCHAFASVHCWFVVTWRERADLLALVCDVYCDIVTYPFVILGQVWYLIVSITDHCCLSYFVSEKQTV